ncbi:amino acid ABC transporter permease [Thaumasiovibrio sp. DFM-14]|uniref:amino acid ABC transporter permease n=1 Tax=Thaumasiovibrio sp. DFM-14 TaxID=3384792 RepID=UPI0039A1826C
MSPANQRWRPNSLDIVIILGTALFIGWLYHRSSIGINYQWHWKEAIQLIFTPRADGNMPYFVQGLLSTIRLSAWGLVLGTLIGFLIGTARFSRLKGTNMLATCYVMLVRNTPPLVFIFLFYFFISNQLIPLLGLNEWLRQHTNSSSLILTALFGDARLWENLLTGALCISMLSAAYIAEVVRAGLGTIPKGQWEAAKTLGLSRWVTFKEIIFPQLLQNIAPALAGQSISIIKDSSIISLISIQELTFVGSEIANSSGLIFEIWLIVGLCYFVLCFSLSLLFQRLEKKI